MWQPLLVLAFVASTFLITPSEGSSSRASASSFSSSGSNSSGGSAYAIAYSSSSSARSRPRKPKTCPHDNFPPKICPKPNEVYDRCPALCPPRECGVNPAVILCRPSPKPGDPECQPGCRCRDGYLRNSSGICVYKDHCPPPKRCPKPNEVYDQCPAPCPPRECGVDPAVILCAPSPQPGDPECQPGCRCRDDYLRNSSGVCVYKDDCPICPNPNEVFDECPAPCPPRRCDVDERLIRCAAPPEPGDEDCEPGCRCADGYVRNNEGVCVTRDQCPPKCGDHEVYSNCPANAGRPLKCSEVGFPIENLSEESECPGEPGCICEEGYVKNEKGYCIPIIECPSCGGDYNATSGCGVNCGRLCSNYKSKDVACIEICFLNACDCKEEYVLDENTKQCVLPKDCTPACGKDEQYSTCINGGCQPKTCSEVGFPIKCAKLDPKSCIKGCLCKEDYVRADNGTCIPKNQCPSCGGDENAVAGCGGNCGRRCSDVGKGPVACPAICNLNGCDCKPGLLLDDNTGKCVEPKKCSQVCGKNEVYSNCTNGGCGPKECSGLGFKIGCVKMDQKYCREGCLCKDEYLRDDNGECIPKSECPECGGDPNAVSGCGINCNRHCSDIGKEPQFCIAVCYDDACDCREGLFLDDNTGKCVPREECTPTCGENEVFSSCVNGCSRKYCSQLGKPVPCDGPNKTKCYNGCVCKEGWLRAKNGSCVPEDQCPQYCPKAHEFYDPCPPTCPPQTCESLNKRYNCPLQPTKKSPKNCKGQCRCEDGYLRNKIGDCILKADCLKCTGPHEYYSCGGACDNVCGNLSTRNQTNCPILNIKCNEMCYCEEGYARDDNDTCVPIEECPKPQCPEGERYEECPDNLCTPQTCSQLGSNTCPEFSGNSSSPCPGKPGCVCDNDYVRDDKGKCIPRDQCPSCGGDPNAVSGCGVNCGRLCSNYDKGPVPCPRICKVNACDCKPDFVLDENRNECVRPEDCTPTCGTNEVFDTCSNGGCRRWFCSQPELCLDPVECEEGCVCQEKYARADNGTCIPESECERCDKPHEYYDSCTPTCPPQTCESIDRKYKCPAQPLVCRGACRCEKGYYRNKNNDCVTAKQCKKCTGPNEYYACGGACDNVCATLHKQNQTKCPIRNIKCNEMCYCMKGYARNDKKICIPIDQCPKPQCPDGERYEENPDGLCVPLDCSQIGFSKACPASSENSSSNSPTPPGCVCENDNVRDDQGNCIPRNQCPSCGGDPNATGGCSNYCGHRCSDYNQTVFCPLFCETNGCRCKNGLVYDDNFKKCVDPKDCTQTCGINEVYSSCGNGGCRRWKCSDGDAILCIDPIECKGGCVCQDGYSRADNGTCIPEDQCPPELCEKPHEYYDSCAPTCPPQTCESIDRKYKCPAQPLFCRGACRCEKGYYRNKNNDCVTAKQCKKCTGPNEYYACGEACDNVCATLHKQNQTNCPIRNIKCNEMCYCMKGYARNDKKICIPIDQCPKPQCPDGERYEENPDGLCVPLDCSQIGFSEACPASSENSSSNSPTPPGCICENDNVRDDQGNCIPRNQCPSCGGDPNATGGCSNYCGHRCSDYNQTVFCPLFCETNGCRCKKGLVYDDNFKKCVDPKDCTQTCGINEVYSSCGNGGCRRWKCSDGDAILCIDPIECKGGCVCQDGYSRADNGTCIPEDQCPPECPEGERYEECPDYLCSPLTCSQLGYPLDCPGLSGNASTECPGEPGCVCDNNYVRDDDGICIPRDQCPSCGGDENAVAGCGINCGRRCSNYKQKNVACILLCKLNACDCRKGYVYDDNIKQCVLPKDCTPTCGINEVYSDCINGSCKTNNCSHQGKKKCIKGCICKENYSRADNGTCVPRDQCQEPHEVYDPCPSTCPLQTCESIGKAYSCPAIIEKNPETCHGACVCEKGYYKNKIEQCILAKECLKCSGPNEYFSCGVACDNVCATLEKQNQTHCPIINKKCNSMCYCEEGYARDKNNTCIPFQQCEGRPVTNPPSSVNKTEAKARLDKASIALSGQVISQLSKTKPGENFVASPTSLLFPLAQATIFSTGRVLQQLLKLLGLLNAEEIKAVFKDETANYKNQRNVTFESASRYYFGKLYQLNETFQSVSEDVFDAKGQIVNFANNVQTAKLINDWVSNRTRGKILDLISSDSLSSDTVVVLVNAIYFFGNWINQFNEDNTQKRNFTKLDGQTVEIDTMYQENSFKYVERPDLNLKAIEMPYKGNNFSFCIILPDLGNYSDVVESLEDPDVFIDILGSMKRQKVQTYIPKMKIDTKIDMVELLKSIGVTEMFLRNSDGFRGMVKGNIPVYITDIVQKAFIEVTEKGTEAAAATGVIFGLTSVRFPPPVPVFRADRPFLFYILSSDHVPRFCGGFAGTS